MKKINWYKGIIYAAKTKNCIVNYSETENDIECWLLINNKKYQYRSWKLPFENQWLEAIYYKKGEEFLLLEDNKLKNLYDKIDNLETIIESNDE